MGISSQGKAWHKFGTICILYRRHSTEDKSGLYLERRGKGRESSFPAESE